MATNCTIEGGSPFRIKRPPITTSGFVSDVDATIKKHLVELNQLLGKRVFKLTKTHERTGTEPAGPTQAGKKIENISPSSIERTVVQPDIKAMLSRDLTPKHTPPNPNTWADGSIAHKIAAEKESLLEVTLSEYIDTTSELSALKYSFQSSLSANWFNLDPNAKTVLEGYPAINDYLVAYAYLVREVKDINGLKNFISNNREGAKNIANYAIVSAARTIVDQKKLEVPNYNDDESEIVKRIKAAGLSLSSASFEPSLQAIIDDDIFNSGESKLIDDADIGTIPLGIKPLLIKYIKNSTVPITAKNVSYFLPLFISQIKGATKVADLTEVDQAESDQDFEVEFVQDDNSLIQINVSAVKCAAQLYYSMVLGDELDVFSIVNYFTHKYLIRGGINILDSRLREDLQLYVFSNRFTDLKSKKIVDNTRSAERQMFYRQVFNYGNAPITEDVIVNKQFTKPLWPVLFLEGAKYIELAQSSFNPSANSKQKIMQAVEDLQYNLSTHCTGMANVITPLIYAELNFVIQRIFMHPEILRQVVPAGGTWWRVVETLYMGMKNARPKATVLYNKAKLGHDIIRAIAAYNPATFEDDNKFNDFMSNIDAFITTQSILQEGLTDELKKGDEEEEPGQNESGKTVPEVAEEPAASAARAGGKEWDF